MPSVPLQSHAALSPCRAALVGAPALAAGHSQGTGKVPCHRSGVWAVRCALCPGCGRLGGAAPPELTLCALAMAGSIALCRVPLPKGILSHRTTGVRAHGSQLLALSQQCLGWQG